MENGGFKDIFGVQQKPLPDWHEFSIPVPWGVIEGREIGGTSETREDCWIGLHGWLDNCGTFTRLAPLILSGHSPGGCSNGGRVGRLICIDSPGHGLSSHYPPGMEYNMLDCLTHIRRVVAHFKLEKFSLIGHSLGGMVITVFAAMHPDMVRHLVVLDVTAPFPKNPEGATQQARKHIDELLKNEEMSNKKKPKVYPLAAARQRMLDALNTGFGYEDNMTADGADCLLPRAVKPANSNTSPSEASPSLTSTSVGGLTSPSDEWVFTRDMRLYVIISSIQTFTKDVLLDFASNIECPHLIVRCSRGLDNVDEERKEAVRPVLDQFRSSNPKFKLADIESTHHGHLTQPHLVAEAINNFLGSLPIDEAGTTRRESIKVVLNSQSGLANKSCSGKHKKS